MSYKIQAPKGEIKGNVHLPVSKSIFNRYLILRHLAGMNLPDVSNSFPDDIKALIAVLKSDEYDLKIEYSGTAMRFATALFSTIKGIRKLSGSDRMHERPIGILVESLVKLGGKIEYTGNEGFPPLVIEGRKLKGGKISVSAETSSQFISAILMIAPTCKEKVIIELSNKVISLPYIEMTIALMREMGVEVKAEKNAYSVDPQKYTPKELSIEKDWSSASFYYQIAALSKQPEIVLLGLTKDSIQGDKLSLELFEKIGVRSKQVEDGIQLSKDQNFKINTELEVDFTNNPDLLQPFVMSCLVLGVNLLATGLYNLHLKETDRLMALKFNINALGGQFEIDDFQAQLKCPQELNLSPSLKIFDDHRMAMSLAPLSLVVNELKVETPNVVDKSFPNFWKELKSLGFEVDEFL